MFDIDFEGAWWTLILLTAASFVILCVVATLMPHNVSRYYIEGQSNEGISVVVVKADCPWGPDGTAFKTTDPQAALDFMNKANAALKAAR